MRRPALIVSLLICYQLFLAFVVANGEEHIINDETARLRVSIRKDSLQGISSCQHSFSQLELQNLVSRKWHLEMKEGWTYAIASSAYPPLTD
jgi:hypothetical protein